MLRRDDVYVTTRRRHRKPRIETYGDIETENRDIEASPVQTHTKAYLKLKAGHHVRDIDGIGRETNESR
jgi:hypothetical protein